MNIFILNFFNCRRPSCSDWSEEINRVKWSHYTVNKLFPIQEESLLCNMGRLKVKDWRKTIE